jgi:5-methylcytosine-specific restriction endonuclease McrA
MDTVDEQNLSKRDRGSGRCELCGRDVALTFHHLIPRKVHGKKRFLRRHGKPAMQRRGLYVCKLCHKGIHTIIPDEKELAESYNTKELLLAHEGIARHVKWAAKQK